MVTTAMDDGENKKSLQQRATHFGVGGIVGAVVMLSPMKNFFFTREEGEAVFHRVENLEKSHAELVQKVDHGFENLRRDVGVDINANTDRILARISEISSRIIEGYNSKDMATNRRVDNMEQSIDRKLDLLMRAKSQK